MITKIPPLDIQIRLALQWQPLNLFEVAQAVDCPPAALLAEALLDLETSGQIRFFKPWQRFVINPMSIQNHENYS